MIALKDINAPMFVVGTETDHISPWRSVYKAHLFTDNEMTFVLTNGGHNAGIVSEPGHPGRRFHVGVRGRQEPYVSADHWRERARADRRFMVAGLGRLARTARLRRARRAAADGGAR